MMDLYSEDQIYNFMGLFKQRPSNTYTFRGPINITHIVNDCIRDGKSSFISIGNNAVLVGVSKQLKLGLINLSAIDLIPGLGLPFRIFEIGKKDIPSAIKMLKDIDKKIKKEVRTVAKQIAKDKKAGKFSNQPETKVLTF